MKSSRAILISIVLCLTICQSVAARDWRVVGNGGGGIMTQNGTPALFENYKKISWIKFDNDQFISLSSVIQIVNDLKIPPGPKKTLLQALSNKTYYLIPKEEAQSPEFTNAKQIYAQLWRRPEKEISVLALTVVESNETIFMPDFLRLARNEQLAILLHEALWTIKPDLDYEHMVYVESAFLNYLENADQTSSAQAEYRLHSALAKYIFGPSFLVQSIFLMSENKSLNEILGPELTHCVYHSSFDCSYADGGNTPVAKVLNDNRYFRLSINGVSLKGSSPIMSKFELKEIFNLQAWKATAKNTYANIPFFHRSHTCVKLHADPNLDADIYLVISDSSADLDYSASALCTDLRQ